MHPEKIVPDEQPSIVTAAIFAHPYLLTLAIISLCCVITRVRTGSNVQYGNQISTNGNPRNVPVVPYWIPFVGHTISFGAGYMDFMKRTAYAVPSGIYALKVAGTTQNIVISPSLSREILSRSTTPVDYEHLSLRFLEYVTGDNGYHREWDKRDTEELWTVARLLHNLMKEPFLTNAVNRMVNAVEERSWNLISGNASWVDQSPWERTGRVDIISAPSKDRSFVAEADLFSLMRNYVGNTATTLLFGHRFLEINPSALDDLWKFDSKLPLMMLGVPWWLPGLPPAVGARERLLKCLEELDKAIMGDVSSSGEDQTYDDVSDVCDVSRDRVVGYYKSGAPPRQSAIGQLVLLWAMNVNANQVIFWMLYYIYSDPEMLEQIRAEISPYVRVHQRNSNGFTIQEAPRLDINVNDLFAKCHILKGVFLETMRVEVSSSSFRMVREDFTATESREDATLFGKSYPETYLIKKDEFVCVPFKVHQDDPRYFPEPERFDAKRFWTRSKDENGKEQIKVDYGHMKVWGMGKTMCKGRNFAEREVLTFVAGVLAVWEIEPVSKEGWKYPGALPSAGTNVPKKDIRVRMTRRKI